MATPDPNDDAAAAVEAAFREGYRCGYSNGANEAHPLASRANAGSVEEDWEWSDARASLPSAPEDATALRDAAARALAALWDIIDTICASGPERIGEGHLGYRPQVDSKSVDTWQRDASALRAALRCNHKWRDVDSMSDREVRCTKCHMPGERQDDGTVFFPAT
jgi:hypothetical protein